MIWIHDACPSEIIGRRAEILWTDRDDRGDFAVVRMLDGRPVEYGHPDGYAVVCTAWGSPCVRPKVAMGPDNRLRRWKAPRV